MQPDPTKNLIADRIRAQHMLEAAQQALLFTNNRVRTDLDTDPMFARALAHAVQEIGEAASKVSEQGRGRIPDVPWIKIVGMRHRLVHGYRDIDFNLLWTVAVRDLPPLVRALSDAFTSWPLPAPPAS